MKHGFMLIELIVATLIATMVSAILLAALAQSNRYQTIVDNLVDMSTRIGVVSNQLEKDLMGSFIPTQAQEKESFSPASSSAKATEDKSVGKQAEESTESDQKESVEKKVKPIEKIFYSTNKEGKFDTLTFITNNPLVVYVGKDVGQAKSKVVRVQYSLRPEEGKKDSYALFRQESMELDLEKYKDVRAYEVIGGIKNCTMTFTARIAKKPEKQAESTQAKPKLEYEYKVLNEWMSEQKKEADKEKSEFPRIPYSVEIKLVLWDNQDKKEKDFTIVCNIPTDFSAPKKEEKKPAAQPPAAAPSSAESYGGHGEAMADKQKLAQNNVSNEQEIVVYNGIQTTKGSLESLKRILGHA